MPSATRIYIYAPRMRDIEVIDSELRLLLAIRRMAVRQKVARQTTARIDALLDERSAGCNRLNRQYPVNTHWLVPVECVRLREGQSVGTISRWETVR